MTEKLRHRPWYHLFHLQRARAAVSVSCWWSSIRLVQNQPSSVKNGEESDKNLGQISADQYRIYTIFHSDPSCYSCMTSVFISCSNPQRRWTQLRSALNSVCLSIIKLSADFFSIIWFITEIDFSLKRDYALSRLNLVLVKWMWFFSRKCKAEMQECLWYPAIS